MTEWEIVSWGSGITDRFQSGARKGDGLEEPGVGRNDGVTWVSVTCGCSGNTGTLPSPLNFMCIPVCLRPYWTPSSIKKWHIVLAWAQPDSPRSCLLQDSCSVHFNELLWITFWRCHYSCDGHINTVLCALSGLIWSGFFESSRKKRYSYQSDPPAARLLLIQSPKWELRYAMRLMSSWGFSLASCKILMHAHPTQSTC